MSKFTQRDKWILIFTIIIFSSIFILFAIFNHLIQIVGNDFYKTLNGVLIFAVIGAYLGTIFALDGDHATVGKSPRLRATLCAIFAGLLALLIQAWPPIRFDSSEIIAASMIGGIFGWWGQGWAKYVLEHI